MFKTAKKIVKTNQDTIGEQYIRNDISVLEVNDDVNIAWKTYYEKHFNTGFPLDRSTLSQEVMSCASCLRDKVTFRESISKIKDVLAVGPSGVVSKIGKTAEEAGVDMITDQVN